MANRVVLRSGPYRLPQKCMMCLDEDFTVLMHNDDGNVIATTGAMTLAEIGYFPMHLCKTCRRKYRIPGVVSIVTGMIAAFIIMQIDGMLERIPEWISATVFGVFALVAVVFFVIAMMNKPAKIQSVSGGKIVCKFRNPEYARQFMELNRKQVVDA